MDKYELEERVMLKKYFKTIYVYQNSQAVNVLMIPKQYVIESGLCPDIS